MHISSLCFFITFVTFVLSAPASDELKIHFFGVEQADSILLVFPSGFSVLVDMGIPPKKLGEQEVTNYILNGIQEILGHNHVNVMVATHIHEDHIGSPTSGFRHILEKGLITTDKFIYRDIGEYLGEGGDCAEGRYIEELFDYHLVKAPSKFLRKWMCDFAAIKNYVKLETAELCSKTQIHSPNDPEIEVTVIATDALNDKTSTVVDDENRYSIGLVFKYRDFTFYTAGDLTDFVEQKITKRFGEIDLYKASHHGSTTSSHVDLMKVIKPQATVILCGDNSYGHPTQACLERLHEFNSDIYVTSEECSRDTIFSDYPYLLSAKGDIHVSTNGYFFTVSPKDGKGGRLYKCKGAEQPVCTK